MLFNSYSFLLLFLPISLLGYFVLGARSKAWGGAWLAACSLVFYGWWDYHYIPLLLASVGFNYLAGHQLARHAGTVRGKWILILSVAGNLGLLAYYKYADFFIGSTNALLGTQWPLLGIVLPIGISFFTFTQIAFLADAHAGEVKEYNLTHYLLFVTYFPHLIAGPVLHHKEMMPQFDDERAYRPDAGNFAIGFTIFAIGLAKKTLLADNLAGYASPIFAADAAPPSLFLAWGGALAYTFQLYFDFSGYSDMAIGLSRLFGVRLPLNFDSPYKSLNIVEFWRRWHMTLSRFLRDYVYIPLGGNRFGTGRRYANLMATMVLGGLWHGAGWTFVVWGTLHGLFLVLNNVWQYFARTRLSPLPSWLAGTITFVCVVFAWVYFRAPDLASANRVAAGMLGMWGVALPDAIRNYLEVWHLPLAQLGIGAYLGGGTVFVETWFWVTVGACVAFLAPNTQEIMHHFQPALASSGPARAPLHASLAWRPCRRTALLTGFLLALGILAMNRPAEFLYFQF